MKAIIFGLFMLISSGVFAQENEVAEEFLPIEIEGKEAFMSSKTGEFTFREHAKTDPTQLKTTSSGVVYTDVTNHIIKKGETLSGVAKKNGITVTEIKKYNKVNSSNLKIGSQLKIVKKLLIKSSSPVISYAGEERIIASLRPGESPGQFAAPPSVAEVENQVIETKKTEEKPSGTTYKAETSIKNPIFGLGNSKDSKEVETIENLSQAINKEFQESKTDSKTENGLVKTTKTKITSESKQEKLTRLKAEVEILEIEIAEDAKKKNKKEIKQIVKDKNIVTKNVTKKNKTEAAYYIVEKGDSLWSISKKLNMTVNALKQLNNIKNNRIEVGQKLKGTPKN